MFGIVLFALTNLAVFVLPGLAVGTALLLGYVTVETLMEMWTLPFVLLAFGMTGSLVSLFWSKWMAKRFTGAKVVVKPQSETETWLVSTVESLARDAKIDIPEIGVFPVEQANAFAIGRSRNKPLVAVSEGLLKRMSRDEARAALAHEISHIANGDMVTLALIQGVVNTYVISLARIIGFLVDKVIMRKERGYGIGFYVTVVVAELAFGLLASAIVFWFSRRREFRADKAAARLAGRGSMIAALRALQADTKAKIPNQLPKSLVAFGINPGYGGKLEKLFSSHPPTEDRIRALSDMQA